MGLQPAIGEPAKSRLPVAAQSRRVWLDVTGTILGHVGPLSPLGADVLRRGIMHLQRALVRVPRSANDPRNLVGVFDGRAWLNLSALPRAPAQI